MINDKVEEAEFTDVEEVTKQEEGIFKKTVKEIGHAFIEVAQNQDPEFQTTKMWILGLCIFALIGIGVTMIAFLW